MLRFKSKRSLKKVRFVDVPADEEEWKAIHRAADRHVPPLRQAFFNAVDQLRGAIQIDTLIRPLELRNDAAVIQAIPWEIFVQAFEGPAASIILDTHQAGLKAALPHASKQLGIHGVAKQTEVSFTLTNPETVRFANAEAAAMVRQINIGTQMAIRQLVVRSAAGEFDVRELARRIKRRIGLTEAQEIAVQNFANEQLALATTPRQVQLAAERISRMEIRALKQRATTIARTETIRAANMGQQEIWRQAVQEGIISPLSQRVWITTPDDRLCPFCRPMDGQVVGLETNFLSGTVESGTGRLRSLGTTLTPPLHPNCLSGDTFVTPGGRITAISKRWYDGEVFIIEGASSRPLSCTPNHPILTRHGWMRARELNVGIEIGCASRSERINIADRDDVKMPARIEDIADAFFCASAVTTIPVPITSPDFHSDGLDKQIAIIGTNSELLNRSVATTTQHSEQFQFIRRHVGFGTLSRSRGTTFSFNRDLRTTQCVMCRRDLSATLNSRHFRPLQRFGLRLTTTDYTSITETSFNGSPRTIESGSKSIFGRAIDIPSSDLIYRKIGAINHCWFSDWVYNLETTQRYYWANGLANHNCRCAIGLKPV